MTTKPPSSLAAGEAPNPEKEDDDLLVDASEDVTVEASEEVTTEAVAAGLASVPSETPPPATGAALSNVPMTRPAAAPTLLGMPLSSIPLPGVIAPGSQSIEIANEDPADEDEVTRLARPFNDEVTRPSITERPSITDDDEEETKVEATDPLMRLDDGSDEVTTALAEQASVEREKALRRSSPSFPASALPPSGDSGVEFADPDDGDTDDDDDAAVMGDDAIDEEVAADDSTANYNDATTETSPLAAAITRRPPPGAPFGRLPAPSSSFGLSLSPAPVGQAPAPSSSPFGSRLASAAGATPFGARTTTGSGPAVQIPAPSAGAPIAPRTSPLFTKYSVPLGGLVAVPVATLILGLIIGGALFGHTAPPVVAVTPAPAPTPSTTTTAPPPVVQPVPPAVVTPPAAKQATETPSAEPPPPAESAESKAIVKRAPPPRPRKVEPLDEEQAPAPAPRVAARPAPKPAPPAAKPVVKKPTKPWVDPFAN